MICYIPKIKTLPVGFRQENFALCFPYISLFVKGEVGAIKLV